ncbi:hypothetical protein [Bacteroides zoogleoformans]|uniref:hypothetical protein n=1 Tax=Bacteroides zoogleoformans TaxID=28119 RepID=UPI00248D42B2|nr:hypothetical protein [Bacteroides zoogleoformans]
MKDQKELLKKCLINEIPAIVFQGTDKCAIEIMQAAEAIYRKNGCSPEFLKDFHDNIVEDFKAYQQENTTSIKLPDLTPSEKEAFYLLQKEKKNIDYPNQITDFEKHLIDNGFIQTNNTTLSHGKYCLINEKDYIGLAGKNGDYEFAINFNKESNQIAYFVFSNDSKYPERVGDYYNLKSYFSDIMGKYPLTNNKETADIVGKIHFYGFNGVVSETIKYTDREEFLKTIEKEIYYNPTGFKYEIPSNNPELKKAAKNIIHNMYGIDISDIPSIQQELKAVINQYRNLGYEDISKILQQYSSSIEAISANYDSKYNIENVPICNSKGRKLTGNLIITHQNNKVVLELSNLRILDKSIGKTEPLSTGSIDLASQPRQFINELLSGKKVSMTNKEGVSSLVKLNKTITGWGISAAKQLLSSADSSAGI